MYFQSIPTTIETSIQKKTATALSVQSLHGNLLFVIDFMMLLIPTSLHFASSMVSTSVYKVAPSKRVTKSHQIIPGIPKDCKDRCAVLSHSPFYNYLMDFYENEAIVSREVQLYSKATSSILVRDTLIIISYESRTITSHPQKKPYFCIASGWWDSLESFHFSWIR